MEFTTRSTHRHPRADLAPREARERFRSGLAEPTSGWCAGHIQANLLSVPVSEADRVLRFIRANPRPCPLLEVVPTGTVESWLASGSDLRRDLPGYRVWESGRWSQTLSEVADLWRPDLVTFLTGCSFGFEGRLIEAGIKLRHVSESRNVAMFRTMIRSRPVDDLVAPLVVSMRPIRKGRLREVISICDRLPECHGAPVWWGDPNGLGIVDLAQPDWGDPVTVDAATELPVFWACGVTLREMVAESELPFAITHAPGMMFIADQPL